MLRLLSVSTRVTLLSPLTVDQCHYTSLCQILPASPWLRREVCPRGKRNQGPYGGRVLQQAAGASPEVKQTGCRRLKVFCLHGHSPASGCVHAHTSLTYTLLLSWSTGLHRSMDSSSREGLTLRTLPLNRRQNRSEVKRRTTLCENV